MEKPVQAVPLDPDIPFNGLSATPGEFWQWAFSDLRANTTRGVLAEFIVARAVGAKQAVRGAWDDFDVEAPDGTRIEVKCSAHLQSWGQKQISKLSFSRLTGRKFDEVTGTYGVEKRVRAQVFVFAVQTHEDPSTYDMLSIHHWQFYVVGAKEVAAHAKNSVGISWVKKHSEGPTDFEALADEIAAIAADNPRQ